MKKETTKMFTNGISHLAIVPQGWAALLGLGAIPLSSRQQYEESQKASVP